MWDGIDIILGQNGSRFFLKNKSTYAHRAYINILLIKLNNPTLNTNNNTTKHKFEEKSASEIVRT